jgi:transcriptional regulator with XRE-family HTH domain
MHNRSASFACVPKKEMASSGFIPTEYRTADICQYGPTDSTLLHPRGMSIGSRIRRRRKELGLTQVELAKLAGIKQGTLSDLETGVTDAPAGDTLAGLCKGLRSTARWIIYGTGEHAVHPLNEDEESVLQLYRTMTADQAATWLRLGRALIDDSPPPQGEFFPDLTRTPS